MFATGFRQRRPGRVYPVCQSMADAAGPYGKNGISVLRHRPAVVRQQASTRADYLQVYRGILNMSLQRHEPLSNRAET